jgi:hypothetical protein
VTLPRSPDADRRSDWIGGRPWLDALAIFAVITTCVFIAVNIGGHGRLSSIASVDNAPYAGSSIFGSWFRFDGRWYDIIATRGYSWAGPDVQSPVAYFPAYPMLLRVLHGITGVSVRLLGSLVTIACGGAMSVLLLRWCRDRVDSVTARAALITLLVYPYAFYFMGAVYADALFAVLVIGAFLLLDHDHPLWAGVLGALATATRPTGIAVVVGLVAVVMWKREVITRVGGRTVLAFRNLRRGDFGVLLSLGGLLGYMAYLFARFDAPLAFEEVQRAPGWDQGGGPRTWLKITWFQQIKHFPGWTLAWIQHGDDATFQKVQYASTVILQGLLIGGFLLLAYLVWKRLGWGYGVYSFALLGIPLIGTKDFQGAGRYLMAAFPCFLVLAMVLSPRPALKWAWWGLSASILLLWAFAFGRGYYLA